ncbi:hypothetical protein LY78DRAFT_187598 [Colletotrichum sublineola]|nr:hypothetical protein LY78DRAFT_187598 [Colletotrichum sublineola]
MDWSRRLSRDVRLLRTLFGEDRNRACLQSGPRSPAARMGRMSKAVLAVAGTRKGRARILRGFFSFFSFPVTVPPRNPAFSWVEKHKQQDQQKFDGQQREMTTNLQPGREAQGWHGQGPRTGSCTM